MTLALSRTPAGELAAHLDDEAATLELGALLARVLRGGLKIYLIRRAGRRQDHAGAGPAAQPWATRAG